MSAVEKLDNIEAICFFPKDFDGSRRFFEDKWGFQPKRIQPTVETPTLSSIPSCGCDDRNLGAGRRRRDHGRAEPHG